MQLERYPFVEEPENHSYEFYSEGPRGRVKKVVEYTRLDGLLTEAYNLSFGDWDYVNEKLDDQSITNNSDYEKVLVSVANSVADFLTNRPDAFIFAYGSTPSRTRLYQMVINKSWKEIEGRFIIKGFQHNRWQDFKPGVNYTAFLAELKK